MRKIMVILMVVALLTGVMAVCPVAASESIFLDTFEGGLSEDWKIEAGTADNIKLHADGIEIVGGGDTVQIRYDWTLTTQTAYEVSAQVKILSHTEGTGLRIYSLRTDDMTATWGRTGYFTTPSSEYQKIVYKTACNWNPVSEEGASLIIEYNGNGSVVIDSIALQNVTKNGLVVNGDFEGDSGEVNLDGWMPTGNSVGKTVLEGENCVSVAGTLNDWVAFTYGVPVKAGDTYRLSFSYRSENRTAPYVYLYFATSIGTNGSDTLPTTIYEPYFALKPATTNWTDYTVTFEIPTEGEGSDFVWFNKISLRGRGSISNYYDNIELTKDETRVSFVDSNNTPVSKVEAGKTAYARVSYTHDEAIAEGESASVTAIGAVYTEVGGVKQLVSVDIKTAILTEDIHAELKPALTVPENTDGTPWAEVFILDGESILSPIMEKTVLK